MVMSRPNHTDEETALVGVVTEDGELEPRTPFARPWPTIELVSTSATTDAVPPPLLHPLRDALAERTSGVLLFGSGEIKDHSGIELVAASLALTEHCGPAARIMPRHRSTPSKDWDVPEAIRQLPFLPSIESAYAQGYRRLIYNPGYTRAEQLIEYGKDALLISGWYGSEVSQVFMGSARHGGMKEEESLLSRIVAIASTVTIPTSDGEAVVADLFVANGQDFGALKKFKEVDEFLVAHRLLRWEEELAHLLDTGAVTSDAVKEAFPRSHGIVTFLDERAKLKKTAETT
jgi:hypothetical protein